MADTIDRAADDLAASFVTVRSSARDAVAAAAAAGAAAMRTAAAPYPYRYAARIAATAHATAVRDSKFGTVVSATAKVGGRRVAFSGGASVTQLVWGAEFGAKGGDVVRVRLSTGASRTVAAGSFASYRARAERQYTEAYLTKTGKLRRKTVAAGRGTRTQVTDVRAGGLAQFPARNADGYLFTPALDRAEPEHWANLDAAFRAALDDGT